MILEKDIPSFWTWIGPALGIWALAMLILLLAYLIVLLLFSFLRNSPGAAFPRFLTTFKNGIQDFTRISWRRTSAIAYLIIQESLRKKVLIVCIVFLLLLMFAGWYLPQNDDPGKTYLSFVFQATSYLTLLLALFLSAFSLPTDFKNKTIFTIATKPVSACEQVLGRIFGLTVIGSGILILMAVMSYFFVSFSLKHDHILLDKEDMVMQDISEELASGKDRSEIVRAKGFTQADNMHRHAVTLFADGTFKVQDVNNHTHPITMIEDADRIRYRVGQESGTVQARVPLYGTVLFRDKSQTQRSSGINVGEEWEYRSYVEGGSDEAVVWTFDHLSPKAFPKELPLEMTISVFRTHMGNIEKPVTGSISVRNPKTGLTVEVNTFSSEKLMTKSFIIPREITPAKTPAYLQFKKSSKDLGLDLSQAPAIDPNKTTYDLFDDFVVDGKLEVWLQCLERGQFFGAARYDLYVRANDASTFLNFIKGYFGIWQQMVIVIAFGVLFSTFLSGPVAMLSTFGIMIAAFFKDMLRQIAFLEILGGGPVEALNRLITHENMMSELKNGWLDSLIKLFDMIICVPLSVVVTAIPPLSDFEYYAVCVASGFNIPLNNMFVHGLTTFAYVVPLFVIGFLILRNREVAK